MYSKCHERRLINAEKKKIINNLLMQRVLEKVEKKVNFPVLDVRSLDEIENHVAKNKDVYVSNISNIIGQVGIVNGIKKILSDKTMAQINYDGLQDKIPFKKIYPFEIFDTYVLLFILFYFSEAIQTEGFTRQEYERDLRRSFKMGKNRYHKANSFKKSKTAKATK
ncbi:uncharacterized protein [Eurosta solidaginis]|uniref:uncharacterized protein n=1 Tax=Eurosta solidaginis TaxID=178769 RepID=UPI00353117DE